MGTQEHRSRLSCKLKRQYANEIIDPKEKKRICWIVSCSIGKRSVGKIEDR